MDTLSWAFNFVPWWVYPAIGIVLVAVFWQPIFAIWNLLPKGVKALLVGAGVAVMTYVAGRNKGSKDERAHRDALDAKAYKRKQEIKDDVAKLPDSAVDDELRRNGWMRDR